jgi:hypothetical protein
MRIACTALAAALLTSPALAQLTSPARANEPRIQLWLVIVASMFLAGLVVFGTLLSSRRTHQD